MSKPYLPGIAENFPNALNVIDKFHVKQVLTNALDKVCKEEQKTSEAKQALFQGRRLFMIPRSRMTEQQAAKLDSLQAIS